MPLRSVEAASRDDAIAAAREQFGPQARVIGVRRVRSGGVLGFFATERYVAEVAPEPARPSVPVPPRSRPFDGLLDGDVDDFGGFGETAPSDFSSPLASASPARARAGAPARNGAAAWAAEAARSSDSGPAPAGARSNVSARPASGWKPAAVHPAASKDDDRVSELAGLLGAQQEPPASGPSRATFPRASFPRTGTGLAGSQVDAEDDAPVRDPEPRVIPGFASGAPSPFTAALARMVAGDQDVRQAVQEALEHPAAARTRATAAPSPTWPGAAPTAETSVPSSPARQEEETVGDQVIAPPPPAFDVPVEVPTWAAEPEVATTSSTSAREEAIADLLRGALAQGHSDEALAGILRKVLAGDSPQAALAETALPTPSAAVPTVAAPTVVVPEVLATPQSAEAPELVEVPEVDAVVAPELVIPEVVVPEVAVPEPVLPEATLDVPAPTTPVEYVAEVTPFVAPEPVAERPADSLFTVPSGPTLFTTSEYSFGDSMWGTPLSQSLWGPASTKSLTTDAPIWDEVTLGEVTSEPVAEAEPLVEEPVAEAQAEESTEAEEAEELAAEPVAEVVAETAEEPVAEEPAVTAAVEEPAALLARTASDPAPTMSLDSTSVMPPLSLLPPLPGSRAHGRGRPPVPPAASRRVAPPTPIREPAAEAKPAPEAVEISVVDETPSTLEPAVPPVTDTPSLATVTRLPVVSVDVPEPRQAADDLFPHQPAAVEPLAEAPAASADAVPSDAVPSGAVPSDVVAGLRALGVPSALLGDTFAEDAAVHGTYSALTRALSLRLPQAPTLPTGAGEVLLVVGPGLEALRTAQSLAASLRLDPDRVQWATRGDLAGLAPSSSRVTTTATAIERQKEAAAAGTVTIVAVDAPLRADSFWTAQMTAIWSPTAVWAMVEATRKPEDLGPWLDGLPRVDALIVQDTDLSADPAAVLRRAETPVVLLDGARATAHRWASLLCERLESAKA